MCVQAVGVEHERSLGTAGERAGECDRVLATSEPRTERERPAATRRLEHHLDPRGGQPAVLLRQASGHQLRRTAAGEDRLQRCGDTGCD